MFVISPFMVRYLSDFQLFTTPDNESVHAASAPLGSPNVPIVFLGTCPQVRFLEVTLTPYGSPGTLPLCFPKSPPFQPV